LRIGGMVVQACNPTPHGWGRSILTLGQPGLHSEFQVSLGYTGRPCLKKY
jgi:hypothetical protein